MHADDLILVSIDDHICEPADMFDGRVPARYRDQAPEVLEMPNGSQQWFYGDIPGRNIGLNAVAGKPPEMYNIDPARYEEMRPGCYDPAERVRDMNAGGQLGALMFPNWTGFSGQVLNEGPDLDVNDVMIRAYNDWYLDVWVGRYPDRFIPSGLIPYTDPERAAAEVKRLAALGCHAVNFPEAPDMLGLSSIHNDHWDPLWAACNDHGTVVNMHIGSAHKRAIGAPGGPPGVSVSLIGISPAYSLVDLVWSQIWHRFPDLRFALSEGGVGWIPYMLQRMDHVHEQHRGWTRFEFPGDVRPSDIFREKIYCCFITDAVGIELLHHLNVDHVMWESDYPHSDGCWPHGPEWVEKVMGHLDDTTVNKLTHENAMRAYRFDPFFHRPRAESTAAALRAESPDVDVVTHVGKRAGDEVAKYGLQGQLRRPDR